MENQDKAEQIVREMERVAPYMYEGLYGNFLRSFMESDRSKWSEDLSNYLMRANQDWAEVGAGNSIPVVGKIREENLLLT